MLREPAAGQAAERGGGDGHADHRGDDAPAHGFRRRRLAQREVVDEEHHRAEVERGEAEPEHHRGGDFAAGRGTDRQPSHAGAEETGEQRRAEAEAPVERLDRTGGAERAEAGEHPQQPDVPRRETELARGEQHHDGEIGVAEHLPHGDRPGERAQRRVVPDLGQALANFGADALAAQLRCVARPGRDAAQDPGRDKKRESVEQDRERRGEPLDQRAGEPRPDELRG